MNDIKVGEFIRTKYGINKILKIDENCYWLEKPIVDEIEGSIICYSSKHLKILKHSFNIIDLIEVKDLVHIILCDEDDIDGENPMETMWYIDHEYILGNIISSIKANRASLLGIVTHEQFSSMEYVLGGKK